MISFDTDSHRFNFRAAAVVIHEGHVLLHRMERDSFWSLPGGRVEPGEDSARTVAREMREELGVAVTVGRMLWVVENFFSFDGRDHHEIGFYFEASFDSASPFLDLTRSYRGVEGNQTLIFSWMPIDRLAEIEVHPTFLRDLLGESSASLAHVIQRDPGFEVRG
jgi:8-oxo-dGTP pyrophosphatase MutT (NUDIX family)